MPVYKLEPIWGKEGHRDWNCSTLSPTPVWLLADSPVHARQRMHLATKAASVLEESAKAPWMSEELVRCTEDASFDVTPDKAFLANGKITIRLSIDEALARLALTKP